MFVKVMRDTAQVAVRMFILGTVKEERETEAAYLRFRKILKPSMSVKYSNPSSIKALASEMSFATLQINSSLESGIRCV